MYPFDLIENSGINLYVVLIIVGIISALVTLRYLSTPLKMPAKVLNFTLLTTVLAIIAGWGAAMLFQAFYNFTATGVFEIKGQTFLGGLIGGAVVFILIYVFVGNVIFKDKLQMKHFGSLLTMAPPAIVGAHAFGRLGCLTAGCCYGGITDSWIGINMYSDGVWAKRVPTQLFEALFLFALYAVMLLLILKFKKKDTVSIYLIAYGVWRFLIEFVRADSERGASLIPGLYPSQVISIFMVIGGVAYAIIYRKMLGAKLEKLSAPEEEKPQEQEENKKA